MLRRLLLLLLLLPGLLGAAPGARSISFTHIPAFGQTADRFLAGQVHNIDTNDWRVVAYIRVGQGWWTKPTATTPLTTIAADGSWSVRLAASARDATATRIAAYVVPAAFVPPAVADAACVPDQVIQAAAACLQVVRPDPGRRNLHWCGRDWYVRTSAGQAQGPGPNVFSDSTDTVFLDAQGRLHLCIVRVGGVWQCSEVVGYDTPGYGRYVFETDSACDALDPNAVLGLFTWSDRDTAGTFNREIDIEWSRWSDPFEPANIQFSVQPYEPAGHSRSATIPPALVHISQQFDWRPTLIAFHTPGADPAGNNWVYPGPESAPPPGFASPNLPVSCDESVHLNLWLNNPRSTPNVAPFNAQKVEVILSGFHHQPLDSDGDGLPDEWEIAHGLDLRDPSDATHDDDGDGMTNIQEYLSGTDPADPDSVLRATRIEPDPNGLRIGFTSVLDRTYTVESTETLGGNVVWIPLRTGIAGNGAEMVVTVPGPGSAAKGFFRVRVE